ncbi:hypothetical protein SGFS_098620 [Streptomyces graminofaciens]|uniref:Uncharacterized protein n=1 Tax=Streptomyces graminofaciens TaxID=68212 RepID=A0ABM7FQE9_9ACTN|nr:hypothetical protein [Streptomyces graminofaciens]BBC38568.1 hypothetical protein SGFS_098620 [Streptomyces graminofaciens]
MRITLLGRANRIGTSLDAVSTARDLASVVVPDFADHVAVDLAEHVTDGAQPPAGHDGSGMSLLRVAALSAQSPPYSLPGRSPAARSQTHRA